jgi:hypothetical protein
MGDTHPSSMRTFDDSILSDIDDTPRQMPKIEATE